MILLNNAQHSKVIYALILGNYSKLLYDINARSVCSVHKISVYNPCIEI